MAKEYLDKAGLTRYNEKINEKINSKVSTSTQIAGKSLSGNITASSLASALKVEIGKLMYPVGSIFFSISSTNPSTSLGFGTWELWGAGQVPIGVDSTDTAINSAEKTTGAKTVSISHTHSTPSHSVTTGASSGNTGSTALTIEQVPSDKSLKSGTTGFLPIAFFSDGTSTSSGSATGHTHSLNSHTHSVSISAGTTGSASKTSVSTMQPSIACYMWKRTA